MELTGILVAFGVLLVLALCWFGFHYWANPPMNNPDGQARVTGNCGDTMEIGLQLVDGKVLKARYWSDGCSISKQCAEAAGMLARGKNLQELKKINMMHVMDITGQLPDTHLHCAQLAETTLQKAVADYLAKQGART